MKRKGLKTMMLGLSVSVLAACGANDGATETPNENGENNEANENNVDENIENENDGENNVDENAENENDGEDNEEAEAVIENATENLGEYDDGTYRGIFADGDSYQVNIQFDLQDGELSELSYRDLHYGGTDFDELDEDDDMYAIKEQHDQALEQLEGESLETVYDLYQPETMIDDVDGFTGATIRGSKIISAFNDALNRGVYSPEDGVNVELDDMNDGTYRGIFADSGEMQVNVQFEVEDNTFTETEFRHLEYGGTVYSDLDEDDDMYDLKLQHEEAIEHLEGESIETIAELHEPEDFVSDIDGFTGATIRSNKLFSAFMDGFNRGVYSPDGELDIDTEDYADGTYRGIFADSGELQVGVEFDIEDNTFTEIDFRQLTYSETDFADMEEGDDMYEVAQQHYQAIDYLEGESIEAMFDLHEPGDFVDDVDGFTGATIRANKITSAIQDALNRGVY